MIHFPNFISGRHCLLGGGGGAFLTTRARPRASIWRSTFSLSRPPALLTWGLCAQYMEWERDTGLKLVMLLSIDLRFSVGFFAITGFLFANNACFEAALLASETPGLIKSCITFNLQVVLRVPHTWHCSSWFPVAQTEDWKKILLRGTPHPIFLILVLYFLSCWKEFQP